MPVALVSCRNPSTSFAPDPFRRVLPSRDPPLEPAAATLYRHINQVLRRMSTASQAMTAARDGSSPSERPFRRYVQRSTRRPAGRWRRAFAASRGPGAVACCQRPRRDRAASGCAAFARQRAVRTQVGPGSVRRAARRRGAVCSATLAQRRASSAEGRKVRPAGIEPAACGLKDRCSLAPRREPLTTELRARDLFGTTRRSLPSSLF